jgi:hypothetical protein
MARYQIRTPDYLEDIITRMAEQSWLTLRTWGILEDDGTNRDFTEFRSAIRDAIAERVRSYKLCGLSNVCIDHLKSTPWSPENHVLDANPYDRIYHLFPKTDLESFLTELTSKSLAAISKLVKPNHEGEASTMLSAIFKLVLSEYLYIDPACGKVELCVYSSSAPVSIWKKRNVRGEPLEFEEEYEY